MFSPSFVYLKCVHYANHEMFHLRTDDHRTMMYVRNFGVNDSLLIKGSLL